MGRVVRVVVLTLALASCLSAGGVFLMPSGLLISTQSRIISLEYAEEIVLFVAKQRGVPVARVGHLNIDIVFGYYVECKGWMATGCYLPQQNLIRVPTNPRGLTSYEDDPSFGQVLLHEAQHWADNELGVVTVR